VGLQLAEPKEEKSPTAPSDNGRDIQRLDIDSSAEEEELEEDDEEEESASSCSEHEEANQQETSSTEEDPHRPSQWQQAQNDQKKHAALHRHVLAHLYIRYEYGFATQPCSHCLAENASLLCKSCHNQLFFCGTCYHACHQGVSSVPPLHFDGEGWLPVLHFVERSGALHPITELNMELEYKRGDLEFLLTLSRPLNVLLLGLRWNGCSYRSLRS